jgi:hypothetical protein
MKQCCKDIQGANEQAGFKILIQNFFVDLSGTNGSLLSIDAKYKIEGNVLFS